MSRTDKTRPRWVQLADVPMVTCVPRHDHRFGPCTLPEHVTPEGMARDGRCRWEATASNWFRRYDNDGYREWSRIKRIERRRSRHQARRELRAHRWVD
jgi:hypothetical protein